jgi:hypothetical protein
VLVEELDELGEVGEGSGEAVEVIDHDDVDLPDSNPIEQLLQRRAVQGGARPASSELKARSRLCSVDLRV